MGAVYFAEDETLGVHVAVKENLFADDEYASQFRREATILAKLRQSNLPRVTDHFVIQGQGQYLVMDYIEGEDLKQRLERTGALPQEEVLAIGIAICDALDYLHGLNPPVVHRDIKPGNVKITSRGQIYLVDFGLAKVVQGAERTATGAQGLTPGYSPPEQYGSARTDERSDIFSLGATLYAALTGFAPTDSLARMMDHEQLVRIRDYTSKASKELASAIEKAMEIDTGQRYQTAAEFRQALLNVQKQTGGEKQPSASPGKPRGRAAIVSSEATLPAAEQAVPIKARRGGMGWLLIGAFALVGLVVAYLFAPNLFSGLIGSNGVSITEIPGTVSISITDEPNAPTEGNGSPIAGVTDEPVVAASPTLGATPVGGGSGQILFASDRSGIPQIYLLDINGGEPVQLTDEVNGACQPDWSPDGAQFVYISPCDRQRDQYENSSLYIRNADGSNRVGLPPVPGGDFDPDWSPDGSHIAFTSLRGTGRRQIWIINLADNSVENFLNSVSSHDFMPSWSPDGEIMLFISTRTGANHIFFREVGAGGVGTQFGETDASVAITNPVWSPDGNTVLFTQTGATGGVPHLITMSWAGRGPKIDISPNSTTSMREGQYSPDGNWIVFESNPGSPNRDIYIMPASGGEFQPLTADDGFDFDPVWRP
jgi:serine/threonine protein kinase/Tol biopolymer transport system component